MTVKLPDPEETRRALRLLEDLDAIPPEVWRDLEWTLAFARGEGFIDRARSAGHVFAVLCPPHIQQQHGWEPRREESSNE